MICGCCGAEDVEAVKAACGIGRCPTCLKLYSGGQLGLPPCKRGFKCLPKGWN